MLDCVERRASTDVESRLRSRIASRVVCADVEWLELLASTSQHDLSGCLRLTAYCADVDAHRRRASMQCWSHARREASMSTTCVICVRMDRSAAA